MTLRPAPPPNTFDGKAPYHVVRDFSPDAHLLRAEFERHFQEPYKMGPAHQVWNYWHVPDSYTYLRTSPDKVIAREPVDRFVTALQTYARRRLGMDVVTWPHLSLYVEGCRQILHNDSRNGAFGYVFSLTDWASRCFSGGETLIFREQDYWASGRYREAAAGQAFYESIPSHFNQLLLFDDRLIHGVPEVRGTNDPLEGRLVLHGHLQCKGPTVEGPLGQLLRPSEENVLTSLVKEIQDWAVELHGRYHGFATTAIEVAASGTVDAVRPLVQRVLGTSGPEQDVALLSRVHRRLEELEFPALDAPSRVTVPIFFE